MDPEIFESINSKLAKRGVPKSDKALLREQRERERQRERLGEEGLQEEEERKHQETIERVQQMQSELGNGRSVLRRANSSFRR